MYLTSKNFKDGRLDLSKIDFISPNDYERHFKEKSTTLNKPKAGDVLFSIIGSIGEPYLVKPQDLFGLSSSVSILRANTKIIFPKYLYYWIRGHIFQNALYGIKGGVAQGYVSLEMIKSLPLEYPPLPTQRKIDAILSAYDDLIENNTWRIQILEDMAQLLYREWFVNFRFPGHETVKMVESELGMVPEGWEIEKVNYILKRLKAGTVYTANDVYESGLVPVIDQSRDIFLGFHNNNPDHFATPEKPIVIFGDHTCKMKMMVEPFSVGPNVVPFISQNEVPLIYLYFLVRNLVETKEYKRHWTELKNNKVVFATKDYTKKFANSMTSLFEHIDLLTREKANLHRTRDLLLPKLISGEVDVSGLDITTGEAT